MLKKFFLVLLLIFNLAGITYLLWPLPPIPDLYQSSKSDEPGDTVQITNVSGYYTNLPRQQVMEFYYQNYKFPLVIRLNHPPEKSRTIFVDTMRSYYLEELVIPFKQSLYVNGFEWENDVFTKPDKRIANKLIYRDVEYKSKVNTRLFTANPIASLLLFFLAQAFIYAAYLAYRRTFFSRHG